MRCTEQGGTGRLVVRLGLLRYLLPIALVCLLPRLTSFGWCGPVAGAAQLPGWLRRNTWLLCIHPGWYLAPVPDWELPFEKRHTSSSFYINSVAILYQLSYSEGIGNRTRTCTCEPSPFEGYSPILSCCVNSIQGATAPALRCLLHTSLVCALQEIPAYRFR